MIGAQQEFAAREQDLSRYFVFLGEFGAHQITPSASSQFVLSAERDELFKTLKANGFLILYNLVESTLKNAIEAIFEEFRSRHVSFDNCTLEVRKLVLKNLKRRDVDTIVGSLSAISTDVLVATFRKEELVAGNVDGRFVRELAKSYGFSSPRANSKQLLTVKTNRNDLAHGLKSFSEVGRDYDFARLDKIRQEVVDFLRALLDSVADYISKRAYLATSASV